ncbi:hypothetical protein RB195_015462 [Necator americanus]|uniref:Uncharacterized protein n=1 Tax=Necator americanus TaxID=51031 RepID=A0ABR1E4P4_NECAM
MLKKCYKRDNAKVEESTESASSSSAIDVLPWVLWLSSSQGISQLVDWIQCRSGYTKQPNENAEDFAKEAEPWQRKEDDDDETYEGYVLQHCPTLCIVYSFPAKDTM